METSDDSYGRDSVEPAIKPGEMALVRALFFQHECTHTCVSRHKTFSI